MRRGPARLTTTGGRPCPPMKTAACTSGMTHRMGAKGQVVIPKAMRDALGLRPGDAVAFVLEGRSLRLAAARPAARAGGSLAGRGLVAMLEADHRAESAVPGAR